VYQQQLLHQQQQFQQIASMNGAAGSPLPQPPVNTEQQFSLTSEVAAAPGGETEGGAANRIVEGTAVEGCSDNLTASATLPSNQQTTSVDDDDDQETSDLVPKMPPLMPASMWTRKDIKVFKDNVRKNPDNVIKIGSLATATVRVPTHEDGTCLFWEFATDSYDIGFGVYFEWTIAPNNQVSVHVSESSDEEELDEEEAGGGASSKEDVEKGDEAGGSRKKDNLPPTDEIIPVYRRDCHDEVYCGSHMYPGQGVYLLKFDNSYSLWRSKTLYYRVYYTR